MTANAETHSQTLGGAWGILKKMGKKDELAKRVKDTTRISTESTNHDSQVLIDTELTTREPTWN